MNAIKTRYLSAVRGLMDCPAGERERLLSRLDSAVSAYLAEEPDAEEGGLTANFGTPEDCAARLLEECRPAAVSARREKDFYHRVLLAMLAAMLAIALGVAAYLWANDGVVIIDLSGAAQDCVRDIPRNQVTYIYDDYGKYQ